MEKKLLIQRQWFIGSKTTDINQDYHVLSEIGSGSYGKVFNVQDRRTSIFRAVKVIQKFRVRDYESFINEVSVLRKLDHPNIVTIIETYETERVCFLVLENCSGGEILTRLIKNKTFSESNVAFIMKQLLSAVMYCHNNGVCHRDLKPENCLYITEDEDSEIKLIDFGLSANLDEQELLHDVTGTLYYIAPEMLAGNYTKVVDCWSLGVMMYLMLSGIPPFQGNDNNELMMAIYNGSITFRHRPFAMVSDLAKDLICRLLTKDPNLRITAAQAYSHPWVQGAVDHYNTLPVEFLSSLQKFLNTTSIKKASLMYIASKLTESDISKIRSYFKNIDKNGDGVISPDELFNGINECGIFPNEKLREIVSALDVNDNGVVDYTEFLTGCLLRRSFSNTGYIEGAFKYFDKDESGFITANEIRDVLTGGELLHNLSTHEIEQMIGEIDKNKDGCIDFREFIEMLNQRSLN